MNGLLNFFFFFFNDTAPPEIYPLSLPDALPISAVDDPPPGRVGLDPLAEVVVEVGPLRRHDQQGRRARAGRERRMPAAGLSTGAGPEVGGGELARLCGGRFRPEAHVHPVKHRTRCAEVLVCLRAIPALPVKLPEAEVTVSDQRPHPELVCERESMAVGRAGLIDVESALLTRDVAEQLECPRFPSSLLVRP